jgi:hemolysin III
VAQPIRRISLEEIVNSLSHGIGLVFSLLGFAILPLQAIRYGTGWHIVGCTVYGTALVCLYLASTLYHGPLRNSQNIS